MPNIDGLLSGNTADANAVLTRENHYLNQLNSKCYFTTWENNTAKVAPSCDHPIQGTKLIYTQMSPAIYLLSGILKNSKFEEILSTVAHEMGHYLYAHGITRPLKWTPLNDGKENLWQNRDGFLYNENDYKKTGNPKPLQQESTTLEIRNAIYATNEYYVEAPLPNEQASKMGTLALQNKSINQEDFASSEDYQIAVKNNIFNMNKLLEYKCRQVSTSEICDAFAKSYDKFRGLQSGWDPFFSDYASTLKKFSDKINLTYLSDSDRNMGKSCKQNLINFDSICFEYIFTQDLHSASYLYTGAKLLEETVRNKLKIKPQITMSDWIKTTKQEADILWKNYKNGIDYLQSKNIGWYSSEQVADDFSIEMLVKLGYNPHYAIDGWFTFATNNGLNIDENLIVNNSATTATCKELDANKFKDANGNFLQVKQVEWFNNHHSICYRIYNITREIDFHKYNWQNTSPSVELINAKATWEKVVAEATELSNKAEICEKQSMEANNSSFFRNFIVE